MDTSAASPKSDSNDLLPIDCTMDTDRSDAQNVVSVKRFHDAADETLGAGAMLLVTSLVGLLVSQLHANTIGLFIEPLTRDLKWSRAEITLGITIVSVISVVMAPLIGIWIDKYGARRIALGGTLLYCLSFALLSVANSSLWIWILGWCFVSFGTVCMKPNVWSTAVASRFLARRGIAMAIAFCGTGVGIAFVPAIALNLMAAYGWRATFVILGVGSAIVTLPLIYFFFLDVADKTGSREYHRANKQELQGASIAEGLHSLIFWKIVLAALFATLALGALIVDFIPILSEQGVLRSTAASLAMAAGLASIIARLCGGAMLDRVDARVVGVVTFFLPVVGCALLLLGHGSSGLSALGVAVLFGFGLGAEIDVIAYVTASHFGTRHYGFLFGIAMGMISLGAGVGPFFANLIFDHEASYRLAIMLCVPALVAAALLMWSLPGNPRYRISNRQRN